MENSFYNTIDLSGLELFIAETNAAEQEKIISVFYKNNETLKLSPWIVWQILTDKNILHRSTPITSVRRAITNLTIDGVLIKLNEYRAGPLGKPEHLWIYNLIN